jgi:hypothetical protein
MSKNFYLSYNGRALDSSPEVPEVPGYGTAPDIDSLDKILLTALDRFFYL